MCVRCVNAAWQFCLDYCDDEEKYIQSALVYKHTGNKLCRNLLPFERKSLIHSVLKKGLKKGKVPNNHIFTRIYTTFIPHDTTVTTWWGSNFTSIVSLQGCSSTLIIPSWERFTKLTTTTTTTKKKIIDIIKMTLTETDLDTKYTKTTKTKYKVYYSTLTETDIHITSRTKWKQKTKTYTETELDLNLKTLLLDEVTITAPLTIHRTKTQTKTEVYVKTKTKIKSTTSAIPSKIIVTTTQVNTATASSTTTDTQIIHTMTKTTTTITKRKYKKYYTISTKTKSKTAIVTETSVVAIFLPPFVPYARSRVENQMDSFYLKSSFPTEENTVKYINKKREISNEDNRNLTKEYNKIRTNLANSSYEFVSEATRMYKKTVIYSIIAATLVTVITFGRNLITSGLENTEESQYYDENSTGESNVWSFNDEALTNDEIQYISENVPKEGLSVEQIMRQIQETNLEFMDVD